jgi:hypothetical protein
LIPEERDCVHSRRRAHQASLLITSPRDGANFNVGETIPIEATAIDLDGYISRAEFFDGEQRIGESKSYSSEHRIPARPSCTASNGRSGAVCTTDARATATSGTPFHRRPVQITVGPASNQPPRVVIVRPTRLERSFLNASIEIVATPAIDGYVPRLSSRRRPEDWRKADGIHPSSAAGQTQTFTLSGASRHRVRTPECSGHG